MAFYQRMILCVLFGLAGVSAACSATEDNDGSTEGDVQSGEDVGIETGNNSCFGECGGEAECVNGVANYVPFVGNASADCNFNPFPLCYSSRYTCEQGCREESRARLNRLFYYAQGMYSNVVNDPELRLEIASRLCNEVPEIAPGDACDPEVLGFCELDACGLMVCDERQCALDGYKGEQPTRATDLTTGALTLTVQSSGADIFVPERTPGCASVTLAKVDGAGAAEPVALGLIGDAFAACGCDCSPGDSIQNVWSRVAAGEPSVLTIPLAEATPFTIRHACCPNDSGGEVVSRTVSTLAGLPVGSYRVRFGYALQPVEGCQENRSGFACEADTLSNAPETALPDCEGLTWAEQDFTITDTAAAVELQLDL